MHLIDKESLLEIAGDLWQLREDAAGMQSVEFCQRLDLILAKFQDDGTMIPVLDVTRAEA